MSTSSSALVVWVRRPRFTFEDWDEEGDDDLAEYRAVYNPYDVLGLPLDLRPVHLSLTCPRAKADIHNAYLELSRRLHPDCRNPALERRLNPCTWIPLDEQFKAITAAHNLLMDPYLRSRYHLSKDLDDQEVYAVMVAAKQAQAMHELEHMQFQYEDVVAEQAAVSGLLIVRALYGDSHQLARFVGTDVMDIPEAIDVTVPVQILVQRSILTKSGREVMSIQLPAKSKSLLPGFYDPNIGSTKHLRVRYSYKDRIHEVEVEEADPLRIPMASHVRACEKFDPALTHVTSFASRVPHSARVSMKRASVSNTASVFSVRASSGNTTAPRFPTATPKSRQTTGLSGSGASKENSHIPVAVLSDTLRSAASRVVPGSKIWRIAAHPSPGPHSSRDDSASRIGASCKAGTGELHHETVMPVHTPEAWAAPDFSVWLAAAEAKAAAALLARSDSRGVETGNVMVAPGSLAALTRANQLKLRRRLLASLAAFMLVVFRRL